MGSHRTAVLFSSRRRAYSQKILSLGPFQLLPLNEIAGATTAEDLSGNNYDALHSGTRITGQRGVGDGNTSAYYSAGAVRLHSAGFASAFNGATGSVAGWVRFPLGFWSSGTLQYVYSLWSSTGGNIIRIYRSTTNNQLNFEYRAGSVVKNYVLSTSSPDLMHFCITWDKPNDQYKVYVNGLLLSTLTGLGTWAGAVDSGQSCIAARSITPGDASTCWAAWWAHWNRALTQSEVTSIATLSTQTWGTGTLYISASGNDANNGTSEVQAVATWTRIEELLNASNAYSTVQFVDGTYTSAGAAVVQATIRGITLHGGAGVIIDGQDARNGIELRANNITVDTFEVMQGTGNGILLSGASYCAVRNIEAHDSVIGIQSAGSHYCTIQDIETYANTQRGIYINTSTNNTIQRQNGHNEVAYAFECESNAHDCTVEDSWFYNNATHGGISKTSLRTIFRRCVAFGNTSSGFYFKSGQDGQVINCDSRGNGTGILLTNNDGAAPGSTNCNITNTIIPSNTTGISVDAASQTNFTSDYNDFHLNTNTGSWGGAAQNTLANWQSATGNDDTHSQVVNPDYVSTVYGGFVPQAAQVLVGANDGGPQGHTG